MGMSRLARATWVLAIANLVANMGIVVTGGAVRVTGSGLGCPTWPRCTEDSYVPHSALGIHGAIEFGNRMLTFAVGFVALACLVAAFLWWRAERAAGRTPLLLSLGVMLGIPAQAVIGGITVRTDLNPWVVSLHLLISLAIVGVCVALLDSVRGGTRAAAPPVLRRLAWLVLAVAWVAFYLGTVVTGSGPHSGDEDSRRTGLDPHLLSHVHASAVYVLLALTLGLLVLAHRQGAAGTVRAASALLAIELLQGVVGFAQYFLDLPAGLVVLHLFGAALLSASVTAAWLSTRNTTGAPASAAAVRAGSLAG